MSPTKFDILFEDHFYSAVFIAEMIVSSRQAAEDIVQEVFIKMLDVDLDKIYLPQRYLYASVRHNAVRYVQSKLAKLSDAAFDENIPDNEKYDLTDEEMEYAENVRKLYEAIGRLPEKARETVNLICFNNYSYNQAAEKMGISVATVKTQMYRSFKALRKCLSFLMV